MARLRKVAIDFKLLEDGDDFGSEDLGNTMLEDYKPDLGLHNDVLYKKLMTFTPYRQGVLKKLPRAQLTSSWLKRNGTTRPVIVPSPTDTSATSPENSHIQQKQTSLDLEIIISGVDLRTADLCSYFPPHLRSKATHCSHQTLLKSQFTNFSLPLFGESLYLHLNQGTVSLAIIPFASDNLTAYASWAASSSSSTTFLPSTCHGTLRAEMQAGDGLIVPPGSIIAMAATSDAVIDSFEFLRIDSLMAHAESLRVTMHLNRLRRDGSESIFGEDEVLKERLTAAWLMLMYFAHALMKKAIDTTDSTLAAAARNGGIHAQDIRRLAEKMHEEDVNTANENIRRDEDRRKQYILNQQQLVHETDPSTQRPKKARGHSYQPSHDDDFIVSDDEDDGEDGQQSGSESNDWIPNRKKKHENRKQYGNEYTYSSLHNDDDNDDAAFDDDEFDLEDEDEEEEEEEDDSMHKRKRNRTGAVRTQRCKRTTAGKRKHNDDFLVDDEFEYGGVALNTSATTAAAAAAEPAKKLKLKLLPPACIAAVPAEQNIMIERTASSPLKQPETRTPGAVITKLKLKVAPKTIIPQVDGPWDDDDDDDDDDGDVIGAAAPLPVMSVKSAITENAVDIEDEETMQGLLCLTRLVRELLQHQDDQTMAIELFTSQQLKDCMKAIDLSSVDEGISPWYILVQTEYFMKVLGISFEMPPGAILTQPAPAALLTETVSPNMGSTDYVANTMAIVVEKGDESTPAGGGLKMQERKGGTYIKKSTGRAAPPSKTNTGGTKTGMNAKKSKLSVRERLSKKLWK